MPVLEAVFNKFKGINRTTDKLNMPKDYLYTLLNGYVRIDTKNKVGVVEQRDGITKYHSVAFVTADYGVNTKVRTIFEAKWNAGGTDKIARAGTAWGKYDDTDSFDTIDGGRTDDVVGQCIMFGNQLIMVDGAVARKMTAAGAVSNLSSDADMPQKSDVVGVIRNKVWLNDTDNPLVAHFSKTAIANGADSWSGTDDAGTINLTYVFPVGDKIISFKSYGGENSNMVAIIGLRYTAIFLAGDNVYDYTLLTILPTTCVSGHATAFVAGDLVYPSRDGVTSIFSTTKRQNLDNDTLSRNIEALYRSLLSSTGSANEEYISGAFSNKKNHYYVNFPVPNDHQMLVYSVDAKEFVGVWKFRKSGGSRLNIYSMHELSTGDILIGGDGYVYTLESGSTDDGAAMDFKVGLPGLYLNRKIGSYFKPIDFEALFQNDGDIDLTLDYWYGTGILVADKVSKTISLSSSVSMWDVALWDVSYWDTEGNTIYRTSDLLGRGKVMFVEISHSESGAKLKIPWFVFRAIQEGGN